MVGSEWERGMGVLTGKVHEAGFDLGTPEAQLHHMALTEIAHFFDCFANLCWS